MEECQKAVQLIIEGKIYSGAEAAARAVGLRWIFKPFTWLYYVPGLRGIGDWFYAWIARNRFRF
jgi:predicted DCC family thiol-disulfide oxidoreductase YuxK